MGVGNYLGIATHVKHRVVWTDMGRETVWVAVKYEKNEPEVRIPLSPPYSYVRY